MPDYKPNRSHFQGQAGVVDSLPLDHFIDFPRVGTPRFFRRTTSARVEALVWTRLNELAAAEGVDPFVVLLTGFGVFLARHTGQEHFAVGCVLGRLGCTAIRLTMSINASTRMVLKDLALQVNSAAGRTSEEPDEAAFIQVLFSACGFAGLTAGKEVDTNGAAWASSDMAVVARPDVGGVVFHCEYDEDLFDPDQLQRKLDRLNRVFAGLAEAPDRRLWDLAVLSPEESIQALRRENDTSVHFPPAEPIHRLFEEQVARMPGSLALHWVDPETRNSWKFTLDQLNRSANRLAWQLIDSGVCQGDVVGLHVERSPDTVIGALAVIKAGGAYLPLDSAYPPARLNIMLQDSRAKALLSSGLHPPFEGYIGQVLPIDAGTETRDSNPRVSVDSDNDFCIIYTSGSTGRPKGVRNHHRATLNCFHWMWRDLPFEQGEMCCAITSSCFGDSIQELFGPLLSGVPLLLVPEWVVKTPNLLVSLLREYQVTRIVLVPSLLRVLTDPSLNLPAELPLLRTWISSGEALPAALARRFLSMMPSSRLINLYGSSEMSNDVTWQVCTSADVTGSSVPIGRPIANMRVYLLDQGGSPVPDGAVGEMYVAGDGLTYGYLNNQTATAESFLTGAAVPTVLTGVEPRVYRTGDLARRRVDGALEFLGRRDLQVKVRGFRIELGEIEAILEQHAGVCRAVATLFHDAEDEGRLAAFVVPATIHAAPDLAVLRELLQSYLRSRLPDYMLPTVVKLLPALPLTPNGKVDRSALSAPQALDRKEVNGGPPAPETERQIARLWTAVLGVEAPSRDETFAELGGHSLAAAILLVRVRSEFGVSLTFCDLADATTLAALAELINNRRATAIASANSALPTCGYSTEKASR